MPFTGIGRAAKDFYVAGLPFTPCYLLDGERPVLFEAGYSCAGRLYEATIREVLGERTPSILFLTHVHYDHCGAAAYLKQVFPSLKIAASERAARILERPNALELMRELSSEAVSSVPGTLGIDPSALIDEPFQGFGIDIVLGDGQTVDLGGATVRVIATPGHTRDLLSYYVPERKLLVATEAVGCQDTAGRIIVTPLTDYHDFLSSMDRLTSLPVEIFCQGHRMVWLGVDEVRDYFDRAIATAKGFGETVARILGEEQGSIDRVVARIKAEEYDTNPGPKQPEGAYVINLQARVRVVAAALSQPAG